MRISYRVREEDVVEFSEFHLDNSPSYARRRWRERFLYPLAFVAFGAVLWRLQDSLTFLVGFLITAIAWVFWWPWYSRRRYRDHVLELYGEGENAALLGTHELIVEEDGLRALSHTGDESKTRWSSIERIVMGDRHLYIYLSAVNALVIPRETVTTGEFDEFARECQERAA